MKSFIARFSSASVLISVARALSRLALRFRQLRFEWPGIDFKKQIARFDEGALGRSSFDQMAGNARANICILRAVDRPDPLAINRHILSGGFLD